jgi:hypothetical protein
MSWRKSEHIRDKNCQKDAENHKMKNSTKCYHCEEIKECDMGTCGTPEFKHYASVRAGNVSFIEYFVLLLFPYRA